MFLWESFLYFHSDFSLSILFRPPFWPLADFNVPEAKAWALKASIRMDTNVSINSPKLYGTHARAEVPPDVAFLI
jgi:hypothetical protein